MGTFRADEPKEADKFAAICVIPAQLIEVNAKYVLSSFSRRVLTLLEAKII